MEEEELKKALDEACKNIPTDELAMMIKMAKMNMEIAKPMMDAFFHAYRLNEDMAINLMAATLVATCMETAGRDIDKGLAILKRIYDNSKASIEHLDRDINKG
jgi:hypothetical protein